jgi:hypothetical protein
MTYVDWTLPPPLPWKFDEININITDANGARVFDPRSGYVIEEETIIAKCKLTVRAVNSHDELVEALKWYEEQARLARLIHSEGDKGRHALADDGGNTARAALAKATKP